MHGTRNTTLLAAATIGALVAVGCGSGKGSSSRSAGGPITGGPQASVAPTEGPDVGTNRVTITTSGFSRAFDPATDQATLGGQPLSGIAVVSTTRLTGVAPAGTGAVDLVVVQGFEQATSAGAYTYRAAEVVRVDPPAGAAGDAVTIDAAWFAADFGQQAPEVRFGQTAAASVSAVDTDTVVAVAPAGSGTVDVTVRTTAAPTQAAVAVGAFTYGAATGADDLAVSAGPANPGNLARQAPAAGVVVGQVRLTAGRAVTVSGLTVQADGSVDESAGLGDVLLYRDDDGDAVVDAGEPQLGAGQGFSANQGAAAFTGLGLDVAAGASVDVLLVTEVVGAAVVGDTVAFRVPAAGATAVRQGTTTAATAAGGAESGLLLVAGADAPRTMTFAPQPGFGAGAQVAADAADVPVWAGRVTTTTGGVDMHGLVFETSGTGDDGRDVLSARLARDDNRNGVIDAADQSLGRSRPSGDDGRLAFNFFGQRLSGSTSTYDLVIEYTLAGSAAAGETFEVALARPAGVNAHAGATNGGVDVTLSGGSVAGARLLVSQGAARLVARAANPAPAAIAAPGAEALALTLDLEAGSAAAGLSGLTVHARGSLDDATDVTAVTLYADDGDGVWGPSDQVVASGSFAQDDGQAALAPAIAIQVAAGQTSRLFATATLAGGAAAGATVALALDPSADLTASGATPAGDAVQGALLIAGAGQGAWIQPGPGAGKDAHLRGEGLYLNDNWGHANAVQVGDRPTGQLGERIALLELPLPALPAGASIQKAYLALHVAGTGGLVAPSLTVDATRIVDTPGRRTPWIEGRGGFDDSVGGVCYDGTIQSSNRPDLTRPDVDPTALDSLQLTSQSAGQWVVLDVTSAAQAWLASPATNLGVQLRDRNFASHVDGQVSFWASDAPWADLRPVLIVER